MIHNSRPDPIRLLYRKAGEGKIKDFTGVAHHYEEPQKPAIHLKTDKMSINESVNEILTYLERKKLI
ncbi:MAG: adenylyl-sulfate kinase [Candidatus Doudnabacteria bacterium]